MANIRKTLPYAHATVDGTGHLMPVFARPPTPCQGAPDIDWMAEVVVPPAPPPLPVPPTPDQHRTATVRRVIMSAEIGAVLGLWAGALPAAYATGASQAPGLFGAYALTMPIVLAFTFGPAVPDDSHGTYAVADAAFFAAIVFGCGVQSALYRYLI